MVGDDDLHTKLVRARDGLHIRDAGIHGDDKFHSARRELLHAGDIHTVPLKVAVRNIVFKIRSRLLQEVVEQDGTRNAVAVVVAPYRDVFSRLNRFCKPFRGLAHINHQERVMQMFVVRRI